MVFCPPHPPTHNNSHTPLCTLHKSAAIPQKPQGALSYPYGCVGIIAADAHKYMLANIEAVEREVASSQAGPAAGR